MMNLAVTAVLLFLLFFAVYQVLRRLEKDTLAREGMGERETIAPQPTVRRPGPPAAITISSHTGKKDYFAASSEALDIHQALIDRGGMSRIGDFSINEMPGYFIRAFTHPERNLTAIIYRDPAGKIWLNLQTEYADGRIITTTTMEKGPVPQQRPLGMPIYHYPGMAADQLLRRHKLETRGVEQAPPLTVENFAAKFTANYARLRDAMEEGGGTQYAQSPGWAPPPPPPPAPTPAGDSETDAQSPAPEAHAPQSAVSDEPAPPTAEQMRRWLEMIFRRLNIPAGQREAFVKGLVWINDRASRDAVIGAINDYSGVLVEPAPEERLVIRAAGGPEDIVDAAGLMGPDLFEKVNSRLPEGSRFTRLPVSVEGVAFYSRMKVGL